MLLRITTSLIGIAIGIAVLFVSDTIIFNIAIAAICVILTEELLHAADCLKYRLASTVCFAFSIVMPFSVGTENTAARYVFCLLCVLILFISLLKNHKTMAFEKLCYMLTTTMLSTLSMCCLVMLLRGGGIHGVNYVLLCLIGAWLGDSGAYFVGRKFGKHKLCPNISPKKTVEGAIGGLLTVTASFVIYSICYHAVMKHFFSTEFTVNFIPIIIIGFICGLLGIAGDLSASVIKREYGIKDFGKIMPGHGGLMDRFDSVLFVAPFMAQVLTAFDLYS
ncbi:MAG: phosphatidate cytidylyltransferase [Ruminococcus sp.]|jgi:phosphatidate cytidylyltransferase|nr:phosphatidate cytidylyltransferase [Ruminococcus sp.]